MKVLLLDNYDSFTYNLFHYLQALGAEVQVARNDAITLRQAQKFTHVVISPGPGLPQQAGLTLPILQTLSTEKPILGVCLGCQAMAQVFGAGLYNQNEVAHGITRKVKQTGESWLLKSLPLEFGVGLYHSWAIRSSAEFLHHFRVVAQRPNEVIMAIEHKSLPLAGVQFHPESIMTEGGNKIIENWLKRG